MARKPNTLLNTVQGSFLVLSVDGTESTTGNHTPRYTVRCVECTLPATFTKQHLLRKPKCRHGVTVPRAATRPAAVNSLVGQRINTFDVLTLVSPTEATTGNYSPVYRVQCVRCHRDRSFTKRHLIQGPLCVCARRPLIRPVHRPAALALALTLKSREGVSPATPCGTFLWVYPPHPQYPVFDASREDTKRQYRSWLSSQP